MKIALEADADLASRWRQLWDDNPAGVSINGTHGKSDQQRRRSPASAAAPSDINPTMPPDPGQARVVPKDPLTPPPERRACPMPAEARLTLDELLDVRWSVVAGLHRRATRGLASAAWSSAWPGMALLRACRRCASANLCLALGPGSRASPTTRALAILLDERFALNAALLVHGAAGQLRRRSGDGRLQAERLATTDQWLLDRFDSGRCRPRRAAAAAPAPAPGVVACAPRSAAEVRVLDAAFRHEYRLRADSKAKVSRTRRRSSQCVAATHPAPPRLTVLTRFAGAPWIWLRLQLRCVHGHRGLGRLRRCAGSVPGRSPPLTDDGGARARLGACVRAPPRAPAALCSSRLLAKTCGRSPETWLVRGRAAGRLRSPPPCSCTTRAKCLGGRA